MDFEVKMHSNGRRLPLLSMLGFLMIFQVAAIMNEHFVNIKVDREERPDVDKVYMTFVQVMQFMRNMLRHLIHYVCTTYVVL